MKDNKRNLNKIYSSITIVVIIGLVIVGLFEFTSVNRNRTDKRNQEYLKDCTEQVANNVDSVLMEGFDNIEVISKLVTSSLDVPEVDISDYQSLIKDSVFDFMEFADPEGNDHNITGGISDARDRQYYLDGMAGNTGVELIMKSRATHETLLMYYTPVYFEKEIIGSIVGVYQASNKLTEILQVKYFGELAPTYLCTENGIVVASNMNVDTTEKVSVASIIAGDNLAFHNKIQLIFNENESTLFGVNDDAETVGCVKKLNNSGFYLVQTFPEQATKEMINDSTKIASILVGYLVVIFVLIIIITVLFYRRQRKLVENANKAKTTFLFNMSHDIRTPMNAITGYTAMAKEHIDDTARVDDCLGKIDIAGKQLLSLVNEVLDMSRIESGKVVLAENEVDLKETCNSILTVIETSASTKGVSVIGSFDGIKWKDVYTDESRLNQILTNILGNSVKYTLSGGKIYFTVKQIDSAKSNHNRYQFVIEDTGIGMSKEFLQHIYDDFSREYNTTTSGVEGTGLGMSIVKRISDLMGGKIDIESEQGIGTKVTFTVDYKIHHGKEDTYISSDPQKTNDISGMRVLLVEDNGMNREIATDLLEEQGVIVESAEDGDIAVSMIHNSEPGYYKVVLMDVQMPRMNGYEATKAIRNLEDKQLANIPIIAMTANAFEEDRQDAFKAGMDGHLAKPIDMKLVVETLSKYK